MLSGIAAGIFIITFTYLGSYNLLQYYFSTSGYFRDIEISRVQELQKYVTNNEISTSNAKKLRKWAKKRNILEFTIFREDWIIFDFSHTEEILPGGIKANNPRHQSYYTVTFKDGEADVYIYEGHDKKYYSTLFVISVVIGFVVCFGIFISNIQEDIKYIKQLKEEIGIISNGNLDKTVTIKGDDELFQLAYGLDKMRKKLNEKEQLEKEMRMAQEKLVLGMSHDLRTPLTGLLTYMEILKKQEREGKVNKEFIDKAYDKILLIKTLSDQMFEYFLIDSNKEVELEDCEEVSSALGDYLSEIYALLECSGFSVDIKKLEWKPLLIQINTDYMGRILNNIISNFEKYADKNKDVLIGSIYQQDWICIFIENSIAAPNRYVEGTGIGLKNVELMMKRMRGKFEKEISEETFLIKLYFPICKNA